MISHRQAFDLFWSVKPPWAGPRAVKLVQAVSLHETGYGSGWGRSCPAMVDSYNLGAIQGRPGALCGDSHADGSRYQAYYRRYENYEQGARALWNVLTKTVDERAILQDDSLNYAGMAWAMRRAGYYEAPESTYRTALRNALTSIDKGLRAEPSKSSNFWASDTTSSSLAADDANAGLKRGRMAVAGMGLLAGAFVLTVNAVDSRQKRRRRAA